MCKGECKHMARAMVRVRVRVWVVQSMLHAYKHNANAENVFTLVFAHEREGWARARVSGSDGYCRHGYGFVTGHEIVTRTCTRVGKGTYPLRVTHTHAVPYNRMLLAPERPTTGRWCR